MLKPEVSLWDLLEKKETNILKFTLKQLDVLYNIWKGKETVVY